MSPIAHTTPSGDGIPAGRRTARAVRWVTTLAVSSLCAAGLAVVTSSPAAAAAGPTTGDAIGSKPKITAVAGGLRVTGWAFDPDNRTANLPISVVMDGRKTLGTTTTSLRKATVTKKYAAGPTPAYSLTVAVPTGNHIVCAVLGSFGAGLRVAKRCVATPLGRSLTAAQIARRSPVGALQAATAGPASVRVAGWAADPDLVSRRSRVVVYVDGRAVATRQSTAFPAGTVRPAGSGRVSWFDVTVPTAAATHIVCVWVVNTGLGRNTTFGCRALDNRDTGATPASTAPATPPLNQQVVALALKQRGKPYVWAATGPSSFDCSGLVMWAYGKYGYKTPRVSQDQIKAARLIPASRAVPGDLVFYHDAVGDVYHVGIYISPGQSFAAISTDQGVNYQRIWDPTATYGSFTHT